MRLALILVCLASLVAIGWGATTAGADLPFFRGAQRIEALLAERVRTRLGEAGGGIEVIASGRDVVLSGAVESEEARDRLLAAVAAEPLARGVQLRLELLPLADPFRTVASLSSERLALSGNVPGPAAGDTLAAEARGMVRVPVEAMLQPARGAPEAWAAITGAGLRALSMLSEGTLELDGDTVTLTGTAPDATTRDLALAAAEGAPGHWQAQVALAVGQAFTAMKTPDGGIVVGGSAPDEAARDALLRRAGQLSTQPLGGEIVLSAAEQTETRQRRATAGLDALGRMRDGLLDVSEAEARLSGTVVGKAERDAIRALLGDGWVLDLVVLPAGPPPADMTLAVASDGSVAASGTVPAGLAAETVAALLPGADASALEQAEATDASGWEEALEAISIILPRLGAAEIRLGDRRLAITGALRRGFSADGTRATLLAALGRGWLLTTELAESEPLAELRLERSDSVLVLSGLLPAGIDPAEAVRMADGALPDGLAGGGAGDPAAWAAALEALGGVTGLFVSATGRAEAGVVELQGVLRPGYGSEAVAARLRDALPDGWTAALETTETQPGEGDRRTGLDTAEPQIFRRGYWLPELDFPVSLRRCESESQAALTDAAALFVTGSADIDQAGLRVVDRLAAIAVRCLNSSGIALEIAGHTDSVGNDGKNQALSEARAAAVRDALVARGVRQDALSAVGLGEAQPVASNDTPEGRARNRRIAFNWSEGRVEGADR